MLNFLEHFGVAVNAIAGALAARGRRVDLFGVVVLALVTAFGGGTVRDLCLGATPVFWIERPEFVWNALAAGLATFFLARRVEPPLKALEFADAFGLALFTMLGAAKSLAFGSAPVIAVALGTITGVAGGILRDVLLNELPLVFRREIRLYATAAVAGATLFVFAHNIAPDAGWPLLLGVLATLALRLAAIRWDLSLPLFEVRGNVSPKP